MRKVTQKQVREWMTVLAKSQGSYSCLLERFLKGTPTARQQYINYLNRCQVKDIHDFVSIVENPRTFV
jgi:hypothetical protein